jgi:hypothetical protein
VVSSVAAGVVLVVVAESSGCGGGSVSTLVGTVDSGAIAGETVVSDTSAAVVSDISAAVA